MAKIKVTSKCELYDGMSITFNAPCDCTEVDGLNVYYENTSQSFSFRDANGNDLTGYSDLFSEGSYVKVVLDTRRGYAYLQNADTNKYLEAWFASILSDETRDLYSLGSDTTADDMFQEIYPLLIGNNRLVRVTVYDLYGDPLPGVTVQGLTEVCTGSLVTNERGRATGYSSSASATLTVSDFSDCTAISTTVATPINTITSTSLSFTEENLINFLDLTASKTLKFSPFVDTVDVTAVGAGCNGVCGGDWRAGQGGGGGFCTLEYDVVPIPFTEYPAIVGSGGSPGGTSSVLGIEATGGSLSDGNGPGGAIGYDGTAGTVSGYLTYDTMVIYGGGGGGGRQYNSGTNRSGTGAGYGGNGGTARSSSAGAGSAGQNGYGGGGGGGGGTIDSARVSGAGGAGGSGRITIRIHHRLTKEVVA